MQKTVAWRNSKLRGSCFSVIVIFFFCRMLVDSNISMLIMQKYQFTVSESFISTYSVKSLLESVGEPGLCPADDRFVELYYVVAI